MSAQAPLLEALEALARRAGAAILEHYHAGVAVEKKEDRSPLTAADRAAHGVIVSGLEGLGDGTPVVSEEGRIPGWEERRGWDRFWLVDPLDGTKEFLKRNGEFTVNIALVRAGAPVLGVVYAPALDVLYSAGSELGAWKREGGGERRRIHSAAPAPGVPLTVVESRSHPSPELEAFLAERSVGRRVAVGSSLKLCWVAEGVADVYPRFGPTMEWDVAAGDCVFRASGQGAPRTSPLTYNKPDLRNAGFVLGLDP